MRCASRRRRAPSTADIEQLPLVVGGQTARDRRVVPLGQIATITPGLGPAQINHLDRDNVIVGRGEHAGPLARRGDRGHPDERSQNVHAAAGLPHHRGRRSAATRARCSAACSRRSGIAVLLMYLILVMQFGSFLDPIAILISLPLSLIGVVLALIITHDTLNIMTLIGVILLMGIVAKNAILLIDFAKWGAGERAGPRARR